MVWLGLGIILPFAVAAWIFQKKSFKFLKDEYKDVYKKMNSDPFFIYRSNSYKDEKGIEYGIISTLIVISGLIIVFILFFFLSL